jgi:hypothetical protein
VTRVRMFLAAILAALGLLTFVHTPAANAVIAHIEIGEEGLDPNAPPPPPPAGALLSLCITIRAAGSTNCIAL